MWPRASLTSLKRSRSSSKQGETASSRSAPGHEPVQVFVEAAPVGQAGQFVGVGLAPGVGQRLHLQLLALTLSLDAFGYVEGDGGDPA